jgi:hypothetical protein
MWVSDEAMVVGQASDEAAAIISQRWYHLARLTPHRILL